MPTKYKKTASEDCEARPIQERRKVKSYPELRMAADIAGVSYWMAYKVRRGKAQSEKVELALKMARERLRLQRAEVRKVAREQLRELKAEERKLQRVLAKGKAA
jgi:hypothetical protein